MQIQTRLIQYIGNKVRKIDTVTGVKPYAEWLKGEVLSIPEEQAKQLLQFPDVWREVHSVDGALMEIVEQGEGLSLEKSVIDEADILEMNESDLRELVKEHDLKIRFQSNDNIHKMRERVLGALERSV